MIGIPGGREVTGDALSALEPDRPAARRAMVESLTSGEKRGLRWKSTG